MREFNKIGCAVLHSIMVLGQNVKIGRKVSSYIGTCEEWYEGGTFDYLYVLRDIKTLKYKVFNEKELIGKDIVTLN